MADVEAKERDLVIEQMVQAAENAPEPGGATTGQVLGGKEDQPAVVSSVESAGWTWVYDKNTGEKSKCNMNMLRTQLRKKGKNGELVFTTIDPCIPLVRGEYKCMLHPESEHYEKYHKMGFPTCMKANIANEMEVEEHMRKKHKATWNIIEKQKEKEEREADRELQREMIASIAGKAKPTGK